MEKGDKELGIYTYIRRLLTAFLAVFLLVSNIPEVYAEGFDSAGMEKAEPLENIGSNDESAEVSDNVVVGEEEINEDVQVDLNEDTVDASENTEESEETVQSDDVNSIVQDTLPEDLSNENDDYTEAIDEVYAPVLLADENQGILTEPTLSLETALSLTADINGNPYHYLCLNSQNNSIIDVENGAGLILLSNVNPNEYQERKIKLLCTSDKWDLTNVQLYSDGNNYSFLGLGSSDCPYKGVVEVAEGSEGSSIVANRALFNAVYTNAIISQSQNINFMMTGSNSGHVVFANLVKKDNELDNSVLSLNIKLTNSNGTSSDTIGGIIGTIESNASVNINLTNELSGTLTVNGSDNRGLFCNNMLTGSSLTASLASSGTVKVNPTGNAGGFVGSMSNGSSLTVPTNSEAVDKVISNGGDAGGLVGFAKDAIIAIITNENGQEASAKLDFSDVSVEAKRDHSAGGLVGTFFNITQSEINLSNITGNITVKGDSSGGIYGSLFNCSSFVINNGVLNNAVKAAGGGNNLGGIIGAYRTTNNSSETEADNLTASLEIKNTSIDTLFSGGNNGTIGGVIGLISRSSYVKMNNLDVNFTHDAPSSDNGGLVGKMGNSSSTSSSPFLDLDGNIDLKDSQITAGGSTRGGIVGYLVKGVVRLNGDTKISKFQNGAPGSGTGQIVGRNEDGLVYALKDWIFTRNSSAIASDIGNWGQVIRLDSENLKEATNRTAIDDNTLFYFDTTEHKVNVLGEPTNTYTINNERDFAAYSLSFNYGGKNNNAINFGNNAVNPDDSQTITIIPSNETNTIDLTNTGILGIGRDYNSAVFKGKVEGSGSSKPIIILDIGNSTYGSGASSEESSGKGGLRVFPTGHNRLGLISVSGETTEVRNLEIQGFIKAYGQQNDNNSDNYCRISSVIAEAKGNVTIENVDVKTSETVLGTASVFYQAGFIASIDAGKYITLDNCSWEGTINSNFSSDNHRIAGFVADADNELTFHFNNCNISGNINAKQTTNSNVGGLIANINSGLESEIYIKNLQISANIQAPASKTSGGLLGYSWPNTNVTFGDLTNGGVIVSASTLNVNNAKFGGLVYQATGYWNATASSSIKFDGNNTFIGKSNLSDVSGLLVGTGLITTNENTDDEKTDALYLEIGTWGSEGSAYYIKPGSVTLTLNGIAATTDNCFDELVGVTVRDNSGNNNSVISLSTINHELIDVTSNNTYKGQIINFKNSKTRYYYNLDECRKSSIGGSTPEEVSNNNSKNFLCWSVSQYAAGNIRNYFYSNPTDSVTFANSINLKGYSYYPVSPLATVTIGGSSDIDFSFNYEEMNNYESVNKPYCENNQHFLMQHGAFYDVVTDLTIQNVTFKGNVGTANGSGALVYNEIKGDTSKVPKVIPVVILRNVSLGGIKVSGIDINSTYAPLLINKIKSGVNFSVDNLSTGTGYVDNDNTIYAATSLIGNVGDSSATNINLVFSNIALDSKTEGSKRDKTHVNNNGTKKVEYNTYHSIFTKATLLNCFQYSADSSGTYNFYKADTKVTYGVETSRSIQNYEEQYEYFDSDGGFIFDDTKPRPTDKSTVSDYFNDDYLPYVAEWNDKTDNRHELNVNKKPINLLTGCGTYGDPYLIMNGKQLTTLAKYLNPNTANSVSGFTVIFNTDVCSAKQGNTAFHTSDQALQEENTINDVKFTWNNNIWTINSTEGDAITISDEDARIYLLNAYYKIVEPEITIKDSDYVGLGTEDKPFSGVIVGNGSTQTTVNIFVNNQEVLNFGGLIRFSQGSVVKDLRVNYEESSIKMKNSAVASGTNNPFFGGIVGYCLGGDTILDDVLVSYASDSDSVILSGDNNYDHLIAVGGYVGLVGGAKDSNGYEGTGGGVIFRNMSGKTNPFTFGSLAANSEESSKYFYCNPFVGRVLDGYALYDGGTAGSSTLKNTNKNYTIPDLVAENGGLTVSTNSDNSYTITISNAQGLWLLSAIVNSGAGAMNSDNKYNHQYYDTNGGFGDVSAYNLGKPRFSSYSNIGNTGGDCSDEAFWGGVSVASPDRVSFLVRKYTSTDKNHVYQASRIVGGNSLPEVTLNFSEGTIDLTSYGNGFRGIGSSYATGLKTWYEGTTLKYMQGRYIRIKEINHNNQSQNHTNTIIKLGINQRDYCDNYYNNGWFAQGAGLFMGFVFSDGCSVNNLTIKGVSKLTLYRNSGVEEFFAKNSSYESNGEVPVGGFANRTLNSSGELTFNNLRLENLSVYGGHHAAGVIGMVEKTGGYKNITFNDWYIGKDDKGNKLLISKKTYNDGSSAGLLGWCFADKNTSKQSPLITINGVGIESDKWNVDGVSINTNTGSNSSATSAGLIGAVDGYRACISGVRVNDIEVKGTNMRRCGGLADGGNYFTVNNCWIEDSLVMASNGSGPAGGILGKVSNSTISNCHLKGTENELVCVQSNSSTGGLIGSSGGNNTITNCSIIRTNIISKNGNSGGLFGQLDGDTNNVSNITFSNVKAVVKNKDNKTGLVVGYTNGKSVNGYNMLADSCAVGYNTDDEAKIDNIDPISSDATYNGLWFGGNKDKINKLVAVATKGTNQPRKDVGKNESGSVQVVYADYPLVQSNTTGSFLPYVDINPKVDIGIESLATTGNCLGITTVDKSITDDSGNVVTNQIEQFIAQTILEEAKTDVINRKYWNVQDESEENNTFSQLLDKSGNAYITSYFEEEQGGKSSPVTKNFPIIVINNIGKRTDVDTPIWNYVAALTNVSSGAIAKTQVSSITATTYVWNNDAFNKQSSSSLNISGTTITLKDKDTYDNQKNQFTLLDIKYNNPTDSNANGFHLYIPVLVKRVMNVSFTVKMMSGTNYFKEAYSSSNYATAGFNEPITSFVEYNYDCAKEEWETMLADGDNLLWNYSKVLDLAKDKISSLPEGTKMTLVDRQTKQSYFYSYSDADSLHQFDLSNMTKDGTNLTDAFVPIPICDLLGLVIDENLDSEKTAYVSLDTEKVGATVKVGKTYYRPATDEEKQNSEIQKYSISITAEFNTDDGANFLRTGEGYYLTLQIPKTGIVINNPLSYSSEYMTVDHGPVALIKRTTESGRNYVIYDGVQQSDLGIETFIVGKTGSIMSDGDSIQVVLTSTLSLTDSGKESFGNYSPTELDHQFNINMKKYIGNDTPVDVLIGAEGASYIYTITRYGESEPWKTETKTITNSESMEKLTIECGNNIAKEIAQYFKTNINGSLNIKVVITLPYPTLGTYFPGRNPEDTSSGIAVSADSRVATATSQLPITLNKKPADDSNTKYYTQNPSEATLIYNTYDGDALGDDTRKLGVNPSDTTNDINRTIYTSAVYNYANIEQSILNQASRIKYTMQLFQKDDNGRYGEPLTRIDEYLPTVVVSGNDPFSSAIDGTKSLTRDFTSNDTKSDLLNIQIAPLTGEKFENNNFTYSNYKVVLTAVLLDKNGQELAGTKATDYIVYTNARIYQRIVDTTSQ